MLYASHYGPFSTGPSWYCSAAAVPAVPTLQRAHPHLLGCTVYLFADLPYVCLPSRRLIIECTSLYLERERERVSHCFSFGQAVLALSAFCSGMSLMCGSSVCVSL